MMQVTSTHAPGVITGLLSAAIISATMSSADSNLLCMSTMFINDLWMKTKHAKELTEKKIIFLTRSSNVAFAVVAMMISLLKIDIITMNTFAFAIRCAGPFAAYGLGLIVPKATKNSGILSIIFGTIGVVFWQILSGGGFYLGILPVVFGCFCSAMMFYIVNWIEWRRGIAPAPSPYISSDNR